MLYRQFEKEIKPELKEELKVKNPLAVPVVEKVVVNMRVPEGKENEESIKSPIQEMEKITGLHPKVCRARRAISGFNLSQGDPIGLKVTLRGKRMYDFLERLFKLVLPRVKDFRGLSREQFDEFGNYNLTLNDQSVFPEINVDKIEKSRSLQITIVTSSEVKLEAEKLLLSMGLPVAREEE